MKTSRHAAPTQFAYLPSEGFGGKRATKHEFARYEELPSSALKYADDHGPRTTSNPIALIYVCTETGAERRWGVE